MDQTTGNDPLRTRDGRGSGPLGRLRAWRDRIRSRRSSHRVYRVVVGALGLAIAVGGLLLVPLPGPGWLIVFIGVAILASEFESARRVEARGKRLLTSWTHWVQEQTWPIRILVGSITLALVSLVLYLVALLLGLPGWVPDSWVEPLPGLP